MGFAGPRTARVKMATTSSDKSMGDTRRVDDLGMTPQHLLDQIQDQGFCVINSLFAEDDLAGIEQSLQRALAQCGVQSKWNSQETAEALKEKPLQTQVYDQLQNDEARIQVALSSRKLQRLSSLLFNKPILYKKAPFRIDAPLDLQEMTLWHQDYFYVKGNTSTITIYTPLQDLCYLGGALSLVPRSHHLGELEHDNAWGKKRYPSAATGLSYITCALKRGDALIFNSLLLHQTNPNYSENINYNIQFRITEASLAHHASMGEALEIKVDQDSF